MHIAYPHSTHTHSNSYNCSRAVPRAHSRSLSCNRINSEVQAFRSNTYFRFFAFLASGHSDMSHRSRFIFRSLVKMSLCTLKQMEHTLYFCCCCFISVVLFTNCTNHLNQCLPKLIILGRFIIFPSLSASISFFYLLRRRRRRCPLHFSSLSTVYLR